MLLNLSFIIVVYLFGTTNNLIICPNMKSAANFTVIGGSAVSNTGLTVINGNLAISPSVALTGFNPMGIINGITELGTYISLQAQKDVTSVYNDLKSVPMTALMTGVDLSGKTLEPGVYRFDSAAGIDSPAGILTLNGNGIYIFQVGSALTTSTNSEIRAINGAKAGCIFWQLGSSATLGQYSRFVGNILAYASVGFATGVTYDGSVYAQTGAISFISDTITRQTSCDVCQYISNSVQGQVDRNISSKITLTIFIVLIISFFEK
jgi:hypothetical protein